VTDDHVPDGHIHDILWGNVQTVRGVMRDLAQKAAAGGDEDEGQAWMFVESSLDKRMAERTAEWTALGTVVLFVPGVPSTPSTAPRS